MDRGRRIGVRMVFAVITLAALLTVASPALAVGDTTPPQILSFTLTPSEIDTDSSDQTVTVTTRITDDLSGVSSSLDDPGTSGVISLVLSPRGGTQATDCVDLRRVSGDSMDGVYVGTATVRMGSAPGIWAADELGVADKSYNWSYLSAADLEARFGAGATTVTNLAATGDSIPPQVRSFSLTPAQVNTESSDQVLTATMRITDVGSGLVCQDDPESRLGMFLKLRVAPLAGPVGADFQLHRVSGDGIDGVYSGTATLPAGSKVGMWRVCDLCLVDKVKNCVHLNDQTLNEAVPGAQGATFANTATAERVTIDSYWCLTAGHTGVVFQPGTVVTRVGGGAFPFYEMAAVEFAMGDGVPTAELDGTPVWTVQVGIPALNLSFSQPVTIFVSGLDPDLNGRLLSIQSLTEGARAWANETHAIVGNGGFSFTVNHATKFAASPVPPRPKLSRVSPTAARRGATVTITGKNFGATRRTGTVWFGGRKVTRYVSWRQARIVVRVPAKAAFGPLGVTVTTAGGASGARSFRVKR